MEAFVSLYSPTPCAHVHARTHTHTQVRLAGFSGVYAVIIHVYLEVSKAAILVQL